MATIGDKSNFENWLHAQSQSVTIAIASRAALRVAPLVVNEVRPTELIDAKANLFILKSAESFIELTSIFFRCSAYIWAAEKYGANERKIAYSTLAITSATAANKFAKAAKTASAAATTFAISSAVNAAFNAISNASAATLAANAVAFTTRSC